MQNLTNLGTIRTIMDRFGFTFSKSLGQNFIVNPSVCPKIAELGGAESEVGVLEIGAGFGVLTNELAARAEKVVVVELDSRLLPVLSYTLSDHKNVKVVNQDILKTDLPALLAEEFGEMEVVVCANLPYYITSPILRGGNGGGAVLQRAADPFPREPGQLLSVAQRGFHGGAAGREKGAPLGGRSGKAAVPGGKGRLRAAAEDFSQHVKLRLED